MAITVVCPSCYKRFSVSEQFAGQKGPCPSCKQVIEIPKGDATVHAPDDFGDGGRTTTGKLILKPIEREYEEYSPTRVAAIIGGMLAVIVLTLGLGAAGIFQLVPALAAIGLLVISPLICLILYPFLTEDGDLAPFRGRDLYIRSVIGGLALAVTWLGFELYAHYFFTGNIIQWWIVIPCFVLGAIAAHASFDLTPGNAFLLYFSFVVIMLVLRWMTGLEPAWEIVNESVSSAPDPRDFL